VARLLGHSILVRAKPIDKIVPATLMMWLKKISLALPSRKNERYVPVVPLYSSSSRGGASFPPVALVLLRRKMRMLLSMIVLGQGVHAYQIFRGISFIACASPWVCAGGGGSGRGSMGKPRLCLFFEPGGLPRLRFTTSGVLEFGSDMVKASHYLASVNGASALQQLLTFEDDRQPNISHQGEARFVALLS
jgi:hypothetical protein